MMNVWNTIGLTTTFVSRQEQREDVKDTDDREEDVQSGLPQSTTR